MVRVDECTSNPSAFTEPTYLVGFLFLIHLSQDIVKAIKIKSTFFQNRVVD